ESQLTIIRQGAQRVLTIHGREHQERNNQSHPSIPLTTARSTAIGRLFCPYESTHELILNLRGDRVDVDTLPAKKGSRILNVVDARRFDIDVLKTGRRKFRSVFRILESS